MSLLNEAMVECVFINRNYVNDGYGGVTTTWTNGAKFSAAIVLNSSIEALVAQKQGVTGVYTVTTQKSINLQYHDVFKRLSDNKVFRVLSDGDDKYSPVSSTLNMRQVNCEEWEIV